MLLCFWCCLQFFLISLQCVCLSISQSLKFCLTQVQRGLFSFSYFLKVELTAFPSNPPLLFLHLRSHNRSHPMLSPIHSCFPLFLFPPLPGSLSYTQAFFFLPSVTLPLLISTNFHIYFSLLIKKWPPKNRKLIGMR